MGVLEGDGLVAAQAEVLQDEFVEIGLGFGRRDVLPAGDEGEAIDEAQAGEMRLNPRVFRVGGDGNGHGGGAGLVQEVDHSWKRGEEFEAADFGALALGFERDAVMGGGEIGPRLERVVGVADGAQEARIIERHAMGFVNIGVGANEGGLGVEDKAVEIENESTDHGE